jgi:hypothetical protein
MKSLLSAGALLLSCTLAQAQSADWTFSYTGFYDREAALFLPGAQLQGSFTGTDANGDGVLERGELTSLIVGGTDYIACAGTSSAYAYCGADSFRFSKTAGLAFAVGQYGSDSEGWVSGGHLITSGQMDYTYHYDPSTSSEHHLLWTGATQLTLTDNSTLGSVGAIQLGALPAVPEAPGWAMLLGGLGAFHFLRRRST